MGSLYVGVDGGGTRTRAVVTASDPLALGRGASGPANARTILERSPFRSGAQRR